MQITLNTTIKTTMLATALGLAPFANAELAIYPAKGIYGLDQPCRASDTASPALSSALSSASALEQRSAIACDFVKAVDNEATRLQMQNLFEQGLKTEFGTQVIGKIEQTNKNRTYVASLEVLRASQYVVTKDSTTDVLLPVTLSLKLTNILTGEVLYSHSTTLSQPIKVLSNELNTPATYVQIALQFRSSLLTLTQQLTQNLKQKINLSEVHTQVVDEWQSYLILDKGYDQGIGKNDELSSADGGLIRVVHADSNYAVAIPVLLTSHPKAFVKTASTARQTLNKPRALIVDVFNTQGESKDLIEQIFADAVGDNAAFSLTPVNKRYSSLAQSIGEQSNLAQTTDIQQRELPEFFIRITVMPSIGYTQSVGKITQQQLVHSEVMAEMLDRSGRVIFSSIAKDETNDIISQNMGLSLDDQREVSLKNALIKLGESFKRGVQFTRTDLTVVQAAQQQISIDNTAGLLSQGMKVHVYSKQKIDGKPVLIPTWEATVIGQQQNNALAQLDLPIADNTKLPVRVNDIVVINSTSAVSSKKAWAFCPGVPTEQLGEVNFAGFEPQLYHALVQYAKRPLYATGASFKGQRPLKDAVQRITQDAGFKSDINLQFHVPNQDCLQPVLKTQIKPPTDQTCANQSGTCPTTLVITTGVRTLNGKRERTGAYGLQQELQIKGLDEQYKQQIYNLQLLDTMPALLKQVVQKAEAAN